MSDVKRTRISEERDEWFALKQAQTAGAARGTAGLSPLGQELRHFTGKRGSDFPSASIARYPPPARVTSFILGLRDKSPSTKQTGAGSSQVLPRL
ncbi:hypothetical protein AAFF_G00120880 [Aldrovandia affinis]|uniref:Uncharacterized protein n=1 Tax=Aldrovandia affinis TaxID=143900 RepID=A0AAD7RSH1_9TELE|nr:hypothetical protein AAFF_G00120880 [Aldrovandia affinis]